MGVVSLLCSGIELLLNIDRIRHLPKGHSLHFKVNPLHSWGLVVVALYFGVGTWLGHGQTPGKRLLRIRVVSLSHGHLSLWHAVERSLGYAASVLEGGFGFVQYFIHPNRQTVHDRIAETIVVKEPKRSKPPEGSPTEPS
jgi:uncharacterized RDD family membrane protein YckC